MVIPIKRPVTKLEKSKVFNISLNFLPVISKNTNSAATALKAASPDGKYLAVGGADELSGVMIIKP